MDPRRVLRRVRCTGRWMGESCSQGWLRRLSCILALCVVVPGAGCWPAEAQVCANGSVCPLGQRCGSQGSATICILETCGNHQLDPGEVCDGDNGCSADCRSRDVVVSNPPPDAGGSPPDTGGPPGPALNTTVSRIDVTLTAASVPADTAGAFVVGGSGSPPPWTASSDAAWLVLDHASGATGDSVTWHLDLDEVSVLDNFATQTGRIRLTAGPSVTPLMVPVQLTKQLPEITNLDRLAVRADEAGTVMVYGRGFQTLATPVTDVEIAGITPTAVTVLSDRALSVSVPVTAAGEYAVTLRNALGIATRTKPLSVLAPVDRDYEEIATEGYKLSLAWNAITQSAYVINADLDLVMRFDLSHTPATITTHSIANVMSLGLPLDRSIVMAVDGGGDLHDLDPTDLTTIRRRAAGAHPQASGQPFAMTGDDLAWVSSVQSVAYDVDRSMPATSIGQAGCYFCAASPDGRRIVFDQDPQIEPGPPNAWWDTVEGKLHDYSDGGGFGGLPFVLATSTHTGDRWILDWGFVYDFNMASQGTVAVPSDWVGLRYAMSRDGSRTYVLAFSDNAVGTYNEPDPITIFPKIFVFDTTGPLITSITYPLLGSFDVAAYPGCLATQGPVACSPYSVAFLLTDDGRTLLAIGDRRLLVIPIPEQYRSP